MQLRTLPQSLVEAGMNTVSLPEASFCNQGFEKCNTTTIPHFYQVFPSGSLVTVLSLSELQLLFCQMEMKLPTMYMKGLCKLQGLL